MHRALVPLLLALAILASGCLSLAPAADEEPVEAAAAAPAGEGLQLGAASALPATPLDRAGAGLDAPPEWRLGEWWRIRFEDHLSGDAFEFDRVVVGVHDGNAVVGLNVDEWKDMLMILHAPGFDVIDAGTLGWEMHDHFFQPLRFPVVDGDA